MSIEKPSGLQKNVEVNDKLLMTAGITKLSTRVANAMNLPLLPPSDPQFQQILKDIVEGIRYIFQTSNRFTFAISGPTYLAFETAVCNILESEDKIMVAIHGVQAERMAKSSKSMGYRLLRLKTANPGDLIDKDHIKSAIETHKPKIFYLCHGDDTSGTLQPLRGIGAVCHENNCLFIVDVSATVVCAPLASDQMEIDVILADTQYALGVSPGLSLLSFNNRAVEAIRNRKKDKRDISYTMDFDLLTQSWGLTGDQIRYTYHYTPAISLLYALRESLALIVEEGLETVIARHLKYSVTAQNDISKIGLKFLVTDENKRLTSVLVILVPDSIRRDAIIDYMFKYYDIAISSGVSPIEKVWRIGIFGPNAKRRSVKLLTSVLRESIEKAKKEKMSEKSNSLSSPSNVG